LADSRSEGGQHDRGVGKLDGVAEASVREVVSRAICDLRNAGVIESNPDGLRIVNLDRLAL
jgi:hypothetical protein